MLRCCGRRPQPLFRSLGWGDGGKLSRRGLEDQLKGDWGSKGRFDRWCCSCSD